RARASPTTPCAPPSTPFRRNTRALPRRAPRAFGSPGFGSSNRCNPNHVPDFRFDSWQILPVQPASSVSDFLAAPVGRYVSGRSFIIWAQTPSRLGSAYFGQPDASDFEALRGLFRLHENPHLRPPYDAICDGRDLTNIDPSAFALLSEYMM